MNLENISTFSIQNTLRPHGDSFGVAFNIADWAVPWYAIFFLLGFFVTIIVGCLICHYRYKVKYDIVFWFSIILIPVSILGARFWSACIGDLDWKNFFYFQSGGLAIQGGVVFAIIAALIYFPLMLKKTTYHVREVENGKVYIRKPSLWIMLDCILPLVLLGQAIGRWGNFFNGEIFGQEISADNLNWLKVIMPGVFDHMQVMPPEEGFTLANGLKVGSYYQPLFLYEFTINIFFWLILYFVMPEIKYIKIGVIGSSYFIIYGITRSILEPLRFSAYEFTGTYVLNAMMLTAGIVLLILSQFILPKYRDTRIFFIFYAKYIRVPLIKIGVKLKIKRSLDIISFDKNLKNLGYTEKQKIKLHGSDFPYFANR